MERIAGSLTNLMIENGAVREEDRELYQFGFQMGMEMTLCLIVTLVCALYLHLLPEYLLFSAVFIPIRSYAGGLHFDKFYQCFMGSCLMIVAVIAGSKRIELPVWQSTAAIVVLLGTIAAVGPVDHENRKVDDEDRRSFGKILCGIFWGTGALTLVLFFLNRNHELVLVMLTLAAALISMIVGKICERRNGRRHLYEGKE